MAVDRDSSLGEGEGDDDLAIRPSDDLTSPVQWDDSFEQAMTALASFPDISDAIPPTPDPSTIASEAAPGEPETAESAPAEVARVDAALTDAVPADAAPAEVAAPDRGVDRSDPGLPLFTEAFDDFGAEPLIKVPAAPRPPLAVRRTPRTPRLRVVPQSSRSSAARPAMELWDTTPEVPAAGAKSKVQSGVATAAAEPQSSAEDGFEVSGAARRLGAVALDHALLLAIDFSVMYFTLRVVGLPMEDWQVLPLAPLAAFLLLVKLSYFWAFTAVGGQTIGKMVARIRVVTSASAPVDGGCALTRALAGAVSASVLGLGYLPALAGSERLALHDYVTHTRVIVLPSA